MKRTADTSAVVAALAAWHERHEDAAEILAGVRVLPAHVLLEAYSVLTRLPGGLAVPPADAARTLQARFDQTPLQLPASYRRKLLTTLTTAGVHGGASYDGLVALEAHAHGLTLVTLDQRARDTYARLGVEHHAI